MSVIEIVANPGRDVDSLDIDAARIDRALTAVRAAGLRRPTAIDVGRATLVFESMQLTGSFKVRGAVAAIAGRIDDARAKGVVAASAGNHGAGVAWAARATGVRATVFVPKNAPEIKRARIRDEGAELLVVNSDRYDDAELAAKELAEETGAIFVSPYDDLDVAAGNGGTLGRDLVDVLGARLKRRLIAPLGGGGLVSGLAAAVPPRAQVWGAQSIACPAIARSLSRGEAITAMHAEAGTLAEGLEGGVSVAGFERARRALAGVIVVEERAIADAMAWCRRELGVLIEGSSAVALVPLLERHEVADGAAIVLTGRNVDDDAR